MQHKVQSQYSLQAETWKSGKQKESGGKEGSRRREKSENCLQPLQKDDQKGQMQREKYGASFKKS